MCGIAGIFGDCDPELVEQMCRQLRHRGPDDEGLYSASKVTLGMRRLAIIDPEMGSQPMTNEDGTLQVVFNGEIYNYLELRRHLESKGHFFSSRSDTEVIVHLYEEERENTPSLLRGDFAFAVWDETKQLGFLARDHLGVKPLYYSAVGGQLVFASELEALRCHPHLSAEIDPRALRLYFTFLYIPHPWSIYSNVLKLEPGTWLRFQAGETRIQRFWDLARQMRDRASLGSEKSASEDACGLNSLYQKLEESVALRLMSDVPLGAFLSGGLDSSTLVAFMSRHSSTPVRTFAVGYGESHPEFNELEFGRLVARKFHTDHREIIVEPEIETTIRQLTKNLDEPLGDSSAVPTWLVSQETAKEVKVVLSGVGGDEVFGGYPRYLGARWASLYQALPLSLRKLAGDTAARIPEKETSRNVRGWIKRFLSRPDLDPAGQYFTWTSFYDGVLLDRLLIASSKSAEAAGRNHFEATLAQVREFDLMDQVFYLDLSLYLPGDLLYMADRMSMAHSLELRVPFCDHQLVEEMAHLHWRRRFGRFRLKPILKKIMAKDLPPAVLKRKKQGFMIPVGSWMQHELKPLLKHYLDRNYLKRQDLFNPEPVSRMLEEHLCGKRLWTNHLWSLLIFQLWHELNS